HPGPSFMFQLDRTHSTQHPFPTRRSSDLIGNGVSSEIHHELAQPGPAQPSPFAEAAPEFVLFVLQDGSRLRKGGRLGWTGLRERSEEHTSELQSRGHLVWRLLLEKKKYGG